MQRKGFVLSMDALFATIIVIAAVVFATSFFSQQHEKVYYLYNVKEVNDAVYALDNVNMLETLDQSAINQEMSKLLQSYEFNFNMTSCDTDLTNKSSTVFGSTPKGFTTTGKHFFILKDNTTITGFGVIKYQAWKK